MTVDQAWRILDPTAPKPVLDRQLAINRRQFFSRSATGIGTAALASLLGRDGLLAASPSKKGGVLGASHLLMAQEERLSRRYERDINAQIQLSLKWQRG